MKAKYAYRDFKPIHEGRGRTVTYRSDSTGETISLYEFQKRAKAGEQEPVEPDKNDVLVEVTTPDATAPSRLKEKILGTIRDATSNATPTTNKVKTTTNRRRPKKLDKDIITKVLPSVFASFGITFIRHQIPEPYKACGPSQKEMVSMVEPLFYIFSRKIELSGKIDEDMLDLIYAGIASAMYGTRAYMTYVEIKEIEGKQHNGYASTHGNDASNARNTNTANSSGQSDSRETGRFTRDHEYGVTNDENGDAIPDPDGRQDFSTEAARVAELFRKDFAGRQQMGLLPRAV